MSALSHLRIVELAETVAGEYCGKLLSDFGAEVIKVEASGRGSPTRALGPFAPHGEDPERSGLFAYLNTNKRSVTLDLQSPPGLEALAKLLERAHAVVDDHAPDWLKGMGLGPDPVRETHPGLVVCAITPFGQAAPQDRAHAEDLTVFHASGWGYHTPSGADASLPPLRGAGRFMASYEAGLDAAMCTVAALYRREESGRGAFIDLSKQEVLASRVDYVLGQMVAGEMDTGAERTAFDLQGPAAIFPCGTGFVYVWLSAPEHWRALRGLLGDPDWMKAYPEHWLERECTAERVTETRLYVAQWLATQDKDAVAAAAQQAGLMVVPVNDASDLQRSPQFQFRRFFTDVDHPVLGRAAYPTVPYRLSATPARITAPAPTLGQHNASLADPA